MDLSAMGGQGKISEGERTARLREDRSLYCVVVGLMTRHCPNKNRNPFCAAAAQPMLQHDQNLANANLNPTPTPTNNPNRNLYPNPFYGNEGNGGGSVGGGQGQLGNAETNSHLMAQLLVIYWACFFRFPHQCVCLVCQFRR